MASGALVIIPDVGGNLAYCEFGVNCLRAAYEEEQSYVDALEQIVAMGRPGGPSDERGRLGQRRSP